ncbi:hypothetical protein DPMN_105328 [Dreissena polymorpha]|uniref:Uncharacterized protein n=1 Tax=Dreissena polymorpha TaxID=45954 RepID=A0A9D4HGN5_DREPO|nr:hypothetical protein DPMN_105328 [Dreissena polymorpha]
MHEHEVNDVPIEAVVDAMRSARTMTDGKVRQEDDAHSPTAIRWGRFSFRFAAHIK